ncbi:hypothetical protein C5Y96_02220 [Blastopirellula marina]|uniref:Uncharacterized protein n=1 Tax=Blastopirellula marina TaxID=124 RepID=A0A2S8G2P5_9BACT|nr:MULTISPECIES: hypothetical protein [Pirellulaceae]PQO38718.1 hypothetical protein C5Y96_02220 [Blastopirellula marina]RCS55026.1 hypothetical protein DTL36_02225 [Bremerella cremea]
MQQETHEPDFKITFTPSRVEWFTDVTSVTVWPTGLQVETPDGTQSFRFEEIGKIQESGIMRFMRKLGGAKPFGMLVADRDWFHPPQDRFFRFYTDPPMKVYMPSDDTVGYEESVFFRVQAVIRCGGYETFDLG